ncbi:MMPL family transporter [Streptomyces sp. NPDC001594]|uniref:MMPL family transporter n=1 Tax=Streptomyces sp. NPDC001594 TaxID=3364590 RepID=UPI00369403D3
MRWRSAGGGGPVVLGGYAIRFPVRTLALVLGGTLLAVLAAVVCGGRLSHGGTTAPGAEAARAQALLAAGFPGAGTPTATLVATVAGSVDDAGAVRAGTLLTERARRLPGVVSVRSYWPDRPSALRGRGGRSALVLLDIATTEESALRDVEPVLERLTGRQGPLRVRATGPTAVGLAIERQSREDLRTTELLAVALTAVVLAVVLGSLTPAGLALLVALTAVVCAGSVLHVLARVTEVSVIALNITVALGFALTVDFALLLVTRLREERHRAAADPLGAAVRAAGRTIACSALTVSCGLAALLVFPLPMLRSLAYGGIAVVALGAGLSVTALPAALALLGRRVEERPRPLRYARGADGDRWRRCARAVTRRPAVAAVLAGAVLIALVLPFAGVRFGTFDDRALPAGSDVRGATDVLRRDFDYPALHPVQVVLPASGSRHRLPAGRAAVDAYALRLSLLPHVVRVESATGTHRLGRLAGPPGDGPYVSPAGARLTVVTDVGPETAEGTAVVRAVRASPAPAPAVVGGTQAWLADLEESVRAGLPWALAVVALTTLVVLGGYTRSVLLPVKALVLNVLSLTAVFGTMVLVFQRGHLRGVLGGFTPTGVTDALVPVLVLCVAFGMSMDYEVLLLSRAVEAYEAGADTREAVAAAVGRTGRLFTASAVVVVVVMGALAASRLVVLKVVGVSLAVAVVVDATLVRLVLAPALMALAGRANWWPGRRRPGRRADGQDGPPVRGPAGELAAERVVSR